MTLPKPIEIKNRIADILKERNISQSQFLKSNNLNPMTLQHMSKFYPRLDSIVIIANALEVSVDSLISGPSEYESAFMAMLYFCKLSERDQDLIMTLMKKMSVVAN